MQIGERHVEGIAILDLDGKLAAGEAVAELRSRIDSLVRQGSANIILNMKDVEYVDSTGLGALVMCFTASRKAGGSVKLLNLNRRNIELLVLTKLTTVFEVFTDEQDAVNSFFPNREVRRFDVLEFVRQQRQNE